MKLRKKSVGLLAAAFAATMLMSGCGQVKIGYIEGSRVMQEAPQVKSLVDEATRRSMRRAKRRRSRCRTIRT